MRSQANVKSVFQTVLFRSNWHLWGPVPNVSLRHLWSTSMVASSTDIKHGIPVKWSIDWHASSNSWSMNPIWCIFQEYTMYIQEIWSNIPDTSHFFLYHPTHITLKDGLFIPQQNRRRSVHCTLAYSSKQYMYSNGWKLDFIRKTYSIQEYWQIMMY